MFTANVASSSPSNAGMSLGSSHLRADYNAHRDSHPSISASEAHCDPESCLESSHDHYIPSAVATAAAVAVCTYKGGDGLSDEARIEQTAMEFKRAMNYQKTRDRIRSIARCKTWAYLLCVAIVVILAVVLIVLAALGGFNTN